MRYLLAPALVAVIAGCGSPERRGGGDDQGADACVGLECRIDNCAQRNMPDTTLSGTVFAPNGTLALYGVNVYIPASDPGPLTDGVACNQCQNSIPGGSVGAVVQTDAAGHFQLVKVPSGVNVPLVIQVGKWRRRMDIPMVNACTDNALPANLTSLPRNKMEGDLPMIAITTGNCDALECLVKKLGVDPKEFTTDGGPGRVHLYNSGGTSGLADGTPLATSDSLWSDLNKLKKYDITAFSCECNEHQSITAQMLANVKSFADLGGRVFMSHYNAAWISGLHAEFDHTTLRIPQQAWPSVATCNLDNYPSDANGIVDQVNNPKGAAFSTWMQNVMGSTSPGTFPIVGSRQSCSSIDNMKAERWVYMPSGGQDILQDFQFTTPQEAPKDNRCGKVVFSDMHVSGTGTSGNFPSSCSSAPLTPQEKALAFMFFDIASCVGPIF